MGYINPIALTETSDAEPGLLGPDIEQSALSNSSFGSSEQFGTELTRALDAQTSRSDLGLRLFEGGAEPFELVDCAAEETNNVTGTDKKDGKVVREHMENGPDVVVSYDDKGTAHRTEDTPITSLPVNFRNIPDWRNRQLNSTARELLKEYTTAADGTNDGIVSFTDISNMMKDIGKMPDLTEVEKCKVWSNIRVALQKDGVTFDDSDEKKSMVDSWSGKGDPWHALITMDDGYHANKLINMTRKDASKSITKHEEGGETKNMSYLRGAMWNTAYLVYGKNTGDVNASEGQLKALRALKTEGSFSAYADAWTEQFVAAKPKK